jgi:2-polyprenyl-3-methyl-5-hydroxy-6-metoxy-1,4-benzoquinol methylase
MEKRETVHCNYCGGKKTKTILVSEPFPIVSCIHCGLVYLSPRPGKKEITRIYDAHYFGREEVGSGYTDYQCLADNLFQEAGHRLQLIAKYVPHGTLIDAGCGFGSFLTTAAGIGYTVTGCDISEAAVTHVKKKYKLKAIVADVYPGKFPKGPFDVITAWDVIEHMPDPVQSLTAFYNSQKENGFLFMTTPDIESIDALILGKYWYGFKRIPEHLYYFSPKSIRLMLKEVGYEVVEVKPWGFHRNLEYCLSQVERYSLTLYTLLSPLKKIIPLRKISLYFPFIDMMVVARKP